jgi:hypothetical protein
LKWVNFTDITLTNSGSALGPLTLVGDCGGNTFPASTFDTPITCYAKFTAASFWCDAIWYTSSGGATATRVPLPQDNAVFDSNSGNFYVTYNFYQLCTNLNLTGFQGNFTGFSGVNWSPQIFGTLTDPSNKFTWKLVYAARSNINISTICNGTIIAMPGFTATLANSISSSAYLNVAAGTFTTNNFNVTVDNFYSSIYSTSYSNGLTAPSTGPTINLGSSNLSTFGALSYNSISFSSGVTVNAGTSTITLNKINDLSSSYTALNLYGQSLNNVVLNMTATMGSSDMNTLWFNGTGGNIANITSTGTRPSSLLLTPSTTWTFTNFNLTATSAAGLFIYAAQPGVYSGGPTTYTATIAVVNNSATSYVAYLGNTKSGAGTLTASGIANLSRNTGITFTSTVAGIAYTGTVGTDVIGSFVVPSNYQGSNLCLVYGGGGGGGLMGPSTWSGGGGGAGGLSIFSNITNVAAGSTIYYQAGKGGAGAPSTFTGGGNSWINTLSNTAPTNLTYGIYAGGGAAPSGQYAGAGSPRFAQTYTQLPMAGGNGSAWNINSPSAGGGGGASCTLYGLTGYAGALAAASTTGGGSGGGGAKSIGSYSAVLQGGAGGQNMSSGTATGGLAGLPGAAGTAGGGGAGGGLATVANANGGAGGDAGYGAEFFINQLNGVNIASTAFGGSGGGGGGGGGANTSGNGGNGGSASISGGGGGAGGGGSAGSTGTSGNGGVGAVIFLYTIPAIQLGRSYGLLVG